MSVDGAVVVEAWSLLECCTANLRVSLLIGFIVRSFDIVDVVIEVAVNVWPSTTVRVYVDSGLCVDGLKERYWRECAQATIKADSQKDLTREQSPNVKLLARRCSHFGMMSAQMAL